MLEIQKLELEQAREELCRLKAMKASTRGVVYPSAPKKISVSNTTSAPPKLRMKRKLQYENTDHRDHSYNLRSRSRM